MASPSVVRFLDFVSGELCLCLLSNSCVSSVVKEAYTNHKCLHLPLGKSHRFYLSFRKCPSFYNKMSRSISLFTIGLVFVLFLGCFCSYHSIIHCNNVITGRMYRSISLFTIRLVFVLFLGCFCSYKSIIHYNNVITGRMYTSISLFTLGLVFVLFLGCFSFMK